MTDTPAYVDIYPPIAIARVGDSDTWYTGPEIPGVDPLPPQAGNLPGPDGFKDHEHKIKRCSPRFRIYAFNSQNQVLHEVKLGPESHYTIKWTVHVANKKAAWVHFRGQFRKETWELRNPKVQPWPDSNRDYAHCDKRTDLIIDSGEKSISGINQSAVPLQGHFKGAEVKLGAIETDDQGRLIVHGGDGHAKSFETRDLPPSEQPFIRSGFNNDDWYDSMFDGHVMAEVTFNNNPVPVKNHSTVSSAPPHFSHGVHCPTNLYELIEDIYERQKRTKDGEKYDVGDVFYYEHIDPLFRRAYMTGWTNSQANDGHGPAKAAYFFDNPELSDPNEGNHTREKILKKRIRAPVVKENPEHVPKPSPENPEGVTITDPANRELRLKQAKDTFMPPLGGDGGQPNTPTPDPERWTSLTQLQYDRLKKWSTGDFKTGERPKVYKTFDEIPLQDQPHALTYAALEWTIGAPLYPGIEVYWVAQFGEMYDLEQPGSYRFGKNAQPGDLTRGLALPWHSDFYMCNTVWWPAVRPDDIVTEEYFLQQFKAQPDRIPENLTERRRWDDGLDRRAVPGKEEDERYGGSEMVRKWFKLGFVSSINYGPESEKRPALIERERYPGFSRIPERSRDPDVPPN